MWRPIRSILRHLRIWRYRRIVGRALALNRSEARPDGLRLTALRNRLEIQWRARGIHPWDRDLAPAEAIRTFVEQSLFDTEAAIVRLFDALPQVDVIDLSVLGLATDDVLIAGTVSRADLNEYRRTCSPFEEMRLRLLGVSYRFSGPAAGAHGPESECPC